MSVTTVLARSGDFCMESRPETVFVFGQWVAYSRRPIAKRVYDRQ